MAETNLIIAAGALLGEGQAAIDWVNAQLGTNKKRQDWYNWLSGYRGVPDDVQHVLRELILTDQLSAARATALAPLLRPPLRKPQTRR